MLGWTKISSWGCISLLYAPAGLSLFENKQTNKLLEILFSGLALYPLILFCEYPRERKREEKKGTFCFVLSFGTQVKNIPQGLVQKMGSIHCMASIPWCGSGPGLAPGVMEHSHTCSLSSGFSQHSDLNTCLRWSLRFSRYIPLFFISADKITRTLQCYSILSHEFTSFLLPSIFWNWNIESNLAG